MLWLIHFSLQLFNITWVFVYTCSSAGWIYLCVQVISSCTSYISSNITYIFELRFGAMLVTIIGLSGLLCICGDIYPLGESTLEGNGSLIGLVHINITWVLLSIPFTLPSYLLYQFMCDYPYCIGFQGLCIKLNVQIENKGNCIYAFHCSNIYFNNTKH